MLRCVQISPRPTSTALQRDPGGFALATTERGTRTALTTSVPVAGELLGIGRQRSYLSARDGEIPTLRFGHAIRVPVGQLAEKLGLPIEVVWEQIAALEDAEPDE